jgi:hypothetical protein
VRVHTLVAVDSGHDSVSHNVLSDSLQLVMGAVLQIQESVQADFLAVINVLRPESLSLFLLHCGLWVSDTGHGDSH